jgi:hypothetical protein
LSLSVSTIKKQTNESFSNDSTVDGYLNYDSEPDSFSVQIKRNGVASSQLRKTSGAGDCVTCVFLLPHLNPGGEKQEQQNM